MPIRRRRYSHSHNLRRGAGGCEHGNGAQLTCSRVKAVVPEFTADSPPRGAQEHVIRTLGGNRPARDRVQLSQSRLSDRRIYSFLVASTSFLVASSVAAASPHSGASPPAPPARRRSQMWTPR